MVPNKIENVSFGAPMWSTFQQSMLGNRYHESKFIVVFLTLQNAYEAARYIRLLRPPISILACPSFISPLRPTTNSL